MLIHNPLVEVFYLRGPLFFGIAGRLVLQVEELIYEKEPQPEHIILSLDQVTAFDHSAAEAFLRIKETADRKHIKIYIVGAEEWKWLLEREGIIPRDDDDTDDDPHMTPAHAGLFALCAERPPAADEQPGLQRGISTATHRRGTYEALGDVLQAPESQAETVWYQTLDEALCFCENEILMANKFVLKRADSGTGRLTTELEDGPDGVRVKKAFAAHSVETRDDKDIIAMSGMSPEDWTALTEYASQVHKGEGFQLYACGQECQEVWILTDGTVRLTPKDRTYGPPRQVSALGLIGAEALTMRQAQREESAEVVSPEAIMYKLTQDELDEMRETKKDLYIAFADLRARALCTSRGPAPPL